MNHPIDKPMSEIVGVQIGTTIYRDLRTIQALLRDTNLPWQPISRAHMDFMACADLGPQWREWSNAPTLFIMDKNGDCKWPK